MGGLIPGEELIYERDGDTVYARYRNPPHNQRPRWIVGSSNAVTEDYFFPPPKHNVINWRHIEHVAEQNPTVKSHLDKLLTVYYTVKSEYSEEKK